MKLVPRLTSPVGFLLALVFLLLPFVAVSCDAPGLGSAEVSYTGLDLATGGQPSVTTEGELTRENGAPVPTADSAPRAGVQALAIITVALLVLGLVISLAPVLTVRRFGAMGAAVAAGTMLIVTQAVAQSHLKPDLILGLQRLLADKPGDLPATGTSVDDLVHSRFGFWLSLIAVLLVLLFNVGSLLWPRISALVRSTREPPPPQ